MEKINSKIKNFKAALETLDNAIVLYSKYLVLAAESKDMEVALLALATRDSMIQRFEYCTDMLWKMLKVYLEDVEKVTLITYAPKSIIRETVQARILSENEGKMCTEMIVKRNETSHVYLQEVAENIADLVPEYNKLMHEIVERLVLKIQENKENDVI